jgi:hypothetical protein
MSNTSTTNGDSQPRPLYGMPMNLYLGKIPPLSSLLGRSTPPDTVGPSGFPFRTVQSCTRTTTWCPNSSEHIRTVRTYHWIVWHHTRPFGCLGQTVWIRIHIRRTYHCILCTNLLHTTITLRFAPYIFKPQRTI